VEVLKGKQDKQYMYNITFWCVHNHCYCGNKTMHSICIVELHANCQWHKNNECCSGMFVWQIYVTGNSNIYWAFLCSTQWFCQIL